MPGDPDAQRRRFHVLRFMGTLKAARDFGLSSEAANAIALRFDPRHCDHSPLVNALAAALVDEGVVDVPGSPR